MIASECVSVCLVLRVHVGSALVKQYFYDSNDAAPRKRGCDGLAIVGADEGRHQDDWPQP